MRSEFNTRTKLKAWEKSEGKCEKCGVKLEVGDAREFDHRIPCALGGDNSLENCVVLCKLCHKEKTSTEDIPRIAKANRVRAKHNGAKKSTFGRLPGSRGSKFKKRIDGTVVVRRDEA